jgi:hypothetical protein
MLHLFVIQSDEANVDRAAQDHYGRGTVFALQFRLDEALPDYAKAYQYRPDNELYAREYGTPSGGAEWPTTSQPRRVLPDLQMEPL